MTPSVYSRVSVFKFKQSSANSEELKNQSKFLKVFKSLKHLKPNLG